MLINRIVFSTFAVMETIIKKWKINKSLLATMMGMTNTTFNKKLDPTKSTTFSESEMVRLKVVLKEMCGDLESVIEVDFNDALKLMVKK